MNIRESIRTILREETRLMKVIRQQVKDHGLDRVAKMMDVSMTKVVELGQIPIDPVIATNLLYENMGNMKLSRSYGEFEIGRGYSGVFTWTGEIPINENSYLNLYVFATPYWDGENVLPIELDSFTIYAKENKSYTDSADGQVNRSVDIPSHFDTIDELLLWYEESYRPTVYNIIMEDFVDEIKDSLPRWIKNQL